MNEDYKTYIRRVHKLWKEDLQELYPQLNLDYEDATKDLLRKIHERTGMNLFCFGRMGLYFSMSGL